jgi:hypothetical protein
MWREEAGAKDLNSKQRAAKQPPPFPNPSSPSALLPRTHTSAVFKDWSPSEDKAILFLRVTWTPLATIEAHAHPASHDTPVPGGVLLALLTKVCACGDAGRCA